MLIFPATQALHTLEVAKSGRNDLKRREQSERKHEAEAEAIELE
ncbi:hypothetical protein Vi05172_g12625 [Venturia inaequalis]|nr:hypothetical protein Vi05172_g12625 [Venturia inaequalis]